MYTGFNPLLYVGSLGVRKMSMGPGKFGVGLDKNIDVLYGVRIDRTETCREAG